MKKLAARLLVILALLNVAFAAVNEIEQAGEKAGLKPKVIKRTVLTEDDKKYALDLQNEARSIVSPTSNNMLKLYWDEELSKTAETYSRECIYAHSHGMTTSIFKRLGENIYAKTPEGTPREVIKAAVRHWDYEKFNYTFATNECTDICGHYTELVWDDNYAVGCGVSTCANIVVGDETWPVGQLVICHYGPGGNVNNRQPYRRGTSCTVCPRKYWCENKLCSESSRVAFCTWYLFATLFLVFIAQCF